MRAIANFLKQLPGKDLDDWDEAFCKKFDEVVAAVESIETRLVDGLQMSRDYYETTHDCKTDSYEQGYRDGMEHAETLICDLLCAPPPATPRGDGGEG